MIECQHLSRWHGDVMALNNLTVTLGDGTTCLVGPNGSGKSTLLRLAVGLLQPSTGSIQVLGQRPWDNPALMRRIGYVPDGPAPWPHLSGRTCVERAARFCGLPDPQGAAGRAIALVGLEEAQDRASGTYSHGMAQRLKLAMAWVHEPELLVLDEPLVGCDPLARQAILDALATVAAQGRHLLVATHILSDVEELGGSLLLLDHGRLVAHGAAGELRDLLDQVPRVVRVGTPDPRALGRELWTWDSVLSVEAEPDALLVRTRDARFFKQLQEMGQNGGVTSITSPDDSVETLFQHLVGA